MGEVISILKAKKAKKEENKGFEGYGEGKTTVWRPESFPRPPVETFEDRVARIRRSLESINRLMKELKGVSQKEESDETKG